MTILVVRDIDTAPPTLPAFNKPASGVTPQKAATAAPIIGSDGRETVLADVSSPTKSRAQNPAKTLAGYQINKRESWRAELLQRHGRNVVRIGRYRVDADGVSHPAGVGIECSADHFDGLAAMFTATKQRLAQGGK